MKTILTTMLVLFALNFTFAQNTAIAKNKSDITSIKESGVGSLVLPTKMTKSEVEAKSKYYTQYFTVAYDEASQKVTFTMVENDEKGRAVIMRFLSGCDVQEVRVGEEILSVNDMYMKYLK